MTDNLRERLKFYHNLASHDDFAEAAAVFDEIAEAAQAFAEAYVPTGLRDTLEWRALVVAIERANGPVGGL